MTKMEKKLAAAMEKMRAIFAAFRTLLLRKQYAFHAPRGNNKTGSIPAWNLLPLCTCSPEARKTCGIDGCYAVKNALRAGKNVDNSSVLKAWTENTVLCTNYLDKAERELEKYFNDVQPRFFRIHASGDFFSVKYTKMWYRIAKNHPETKYLAFTKQWDNVRDIPFYELDNFSLVLSGWTGVNIPEDLLKKYHAAWCDDGTENRIPENALECPGNCDKCGMCWNLKEMDRDVYFHKH